MQLRTLSMNFIQSIYRPFHPKVKLFGMITGGFVVGYSLFSPGKHFRVKHPLGMQYLRDDYGRVHPMITEWVWGADTGRVVLIEKAKVATIAAVTPQLKQLFVEQNARAVLQRIMMERAQQMQISSENKPEEPVENQRFPGEVGLTEEEQIMRAMKFKEFANPTLH